MTARGEAMHGLNYLGKTVTAVLAMLRARHVTVAQYHYLTASQDSCGKLPAHIPGSWQVNEADPWAPDQVLLPVGPADAGAGRHCSGGNGTGKPAPKASPTAGVAPPASS